MDDLDSKIKETESLLDKLIKQRHENERTAHEQYFEQLLVKAVNQPVEVEYDYADEKLELLFTPTTDLLLHLIENHPYCRITTDDGIVFSIVDDYTWEFRLSGPVEEMLELCKKYKFRLDLWPLGHDIETLSAELGACQDIFQELEEIRDGNGKDESSD